MTDAATQPEGDAPKKPSALLPLLLGLVLALAMGGAGFYAAYSGLLPIGGGSDESVAGHGAPAAADGHGGDTHGDAGADMAGLAAVEFVPIPAMVVTLAAPGATRHLRFEAQLEIAPGEARSVEALMPRILDVLNGYLRAVRIEDLERPTALLTLRAHMLRRVQLVVGHARVRDLLVTEFVLN